MLAKGIALFIVGSIVAACTATPGVENNPLKRKFNWFSYVEGGDFKAACAPGADNRYRLIYNAIYTEQVRIYDLLAPSKTLKTRILLPIDTQYNVDYLTQLVDVWRGKTADVKLITADVDGLIHDLETVGVFDQPNVGVELSSKGFFWTVAACHKGQYHFTGFSWPSDVWAKLRFDGRLFALDSTNIPINVPRKTKTKRTFSHTNKGKREKAGEYHLKVGENGLVRLGLWEF